MNLLQSELIKLENDGFLIKRNILKDQEIDQIKNIILKQKSSKGIKESHYPININNYLIKLFKLDYGKIKDGLFFLKIKKKLNLDLVSNEIFKGKSNLIMVDGYWNPIKKQEILPWHSDQAYSGKQNVDKIKSPDIFYLKFFFYLTNVGPNNGCTSYIPCSHKITYAVRSCLFEKKIKYEPFWSLNDLVKFIKKKENYKLIVEKLETESQMDDFLNKANIILSEPEKSFFDFEALPGDLLIFNDSGVHRGSQPSLNTRVALRYLYKKDIF